MKPGDHPEFFRFPAPEGRSRESTIRLDAEGRFFHDGERVEHPGLEAAMHTWISRHPDDGRYILTNGYDWTYFTVEDVPYFVRSLRVEPDAGSAEGGTARTPDAVVLRLSDGTEEPWNPRETRVLGERIVTLVKRSARGGPFEARFDRHAQIALGAVLDEEDGELVARVGGALVPLGG